MATQHFADLLELHDVRPTANRIVIAEALAHMGHPVSMSELEGHILTIDKSGIYRALAEFRKHHLVHAIDGGDGEIKYELCHSQNHGHDDDRHAHFFCERCHQTFCLDYAAIPPISIPDGFVASSVNYMVKGLCPDCARRQNRK